MEKLTMSYRYQQGVTLIEVLVSMFLLGIAVIGFVALQVRAMSATGESLYRSQAMSIAQDLSERMRANYGNIAKYRTTDWAVMPTTDCYAAACTADNMVSFDIRLAKEVAASTLPNGNVAARKCGGSTNICVYVSWGETTTQNGGQANACATNTGSYVGTPECVMLEVYNET
jgi:type IV pilus assembly protein PilV